eukprot:s999_g3.t1
MLSCLFRHCLHRLEDGLVLYLSSGTMGLKLAGAPAAAWGYQYDCGLWPRILGGEESAQNDSAEPDCQSASAEVGSPGVSFFPFH